jgi:hypothetical protein
MPRKTNAPKPKTKKSSEGIAPTAMVAGETIKPVKDAPKRISYSIELAARICKEMLERDEEDKTRSLRDVCRLDGMPVERTVYDWLVDHPEFAQMYVRTRETLADMNASDILKIADTAEDANLARLRIDARKWWAAKVSPKKYGDKLELGGDPNAPINHAHKIVFEVIDVKPDDARE